MNNLEPAVGDVITENGKQHVTTIQPKGNECKHCSLYDHYSCVNYRCISSHRRDGKNIYFVEVGND